MARRGYSEATALNDPRTELVILGLSENAAVTTCGWRAISSTEAVRVGSKRKSRSVGIQTPFVIRRSLSQPVNECNRDVTTVTPLSTLTTT